jgi:hypothetical protein
MEAAAAGLASREHVSVWAEELERLAVDVCSLPTAAHGAIRTVLDSVALEDAVEAEEAKHLRNEIDALKRGSVSQPGLRDIRVAGAIADRRFSRLARAALLVRG